MLISFIDFKHLGFMKGVDVCLLDILFFASLFSLCVCFSAVLNFLYNCFYIKRQLLRWYQRSRFCKKRKYGGDFGENCRL